MNFFSPPQILLKLHCGGCFKATSRACSDGLFVRCLTASIYSLVLFTILKQIRLPLEIHVWHFCFLASDLCSFFLTITENVNRLNGAGSLATIVSQGSYKQKGVIFACCFSREYSYGKE